MPARVLSLLSAFTLLISCLLAVFIKLEAELRREFQVSTEDQNPERVSGTKGTAI